MRVSELLHRNSVLLHADLTTRDQAIDLLVDLQEANGVITNATAYYNEISRREATGGTTAIGEGIALPHARNAGVAAPGVAALGLRRGIDWGFNAWGGDVDGLYPSWERDNRVARKFCDLLENDCYNKRDFICEGGSIHVDGEGTALVTEACLLSAGRNPDLSRKQIEQVLCDYLGVSKVIWLPRGIYNDETNEHVDNVCAFVAPGEVVLAWTDNQTDPQYELSAASLAALEAATDAKGRKLRVHKLPLPAPVTITAEECEGLDLCDGEPTRTPGERLAASYVNFYIANGAVVMPAFGDPMDEKAQEILQTLFPTRKVIAIPARDILIGGGNIHCITQQIPKA